MAVNDTKIIIRNLKAGFSWNAFIKRCFWIGVFLFIGWVCNLVWFKPYSIEVFYERMFLEYALLNPEESSEYRILETLGFHLNNHRLNTISQEQYQKNTKFKIEQYDMLQSYKRNAQTEDELFSTDLLLNYFEDAVFRVQFPYDEFPIDHIEGPHVKIPFFLVNCHAVQKFSDAEDYLERITAIPEKLQQAAAYMDRLVEYNALPPKPILENMIGQCEIFLHDGLEYNLLYLDLNEKLGELENIPQEPISDLRYALRREVEDGLIPAYQNFKLYLEGLLENAPSEIGVSRIPDGDSYYRYLVAKNLTIENQLLFTDLTIDSLITVANEQLEFASREIEYSMISLGFPTSLSLKEKLEKINQNRKFFYSSNRNGRSNFMADLALITYQSKKDTERTFEMEVKGGLEFRRLPDFYEPYFTEGYYYPGSLDFFREGVLYVNLNDMSWYPKYALTAMALNYGYPGRHFQKQIQHESETPSFRKVLSFRAFEEGWVRYSQNKLLKSNTYTSPPVLVAIKHQFLLEAARMVVDLGIHSQGWTYQQAISFLEEKAAISQKRAKAHVDQLIVQPASALPAFYGAQMLEKGERLALSVNKDITPKHYLQEMLKMGPAPVKFWTHRISKLRKKTD